MYICINNTKIMALIINSSTTKRILTLKSKLGFGKYADVTISDIIKINKCDYLRWVYFNYNGIDFLPEVLNVIHIPLEYRLVKPDKNPDILTEVNLKADEKHKYRYDKEKIVDKDLEKIKMCKKKKKKKFFESKISLMNKNHGHK